MDDGVARRLFFGRKDELSRLAQLTADKDGRYRGAVVTGQSGLGKSRLLEAAAAQATLDGAVILQGSCLDIGDSWPLHPLREAARAVRTQFGDLPAATRLIDTLEGRVPSDSRPDLVAAAHLELTTLSHAKPVVLVVDDLQWVDSSTIRLIRTLLSGLTSNSISLLGALRTDATDPSNYSPLLVEFHGSPAVEVLELGPLDENATLELARSVAERPISGRESGTLWQRSGGVPLLVEAIVAEGENSVEDLNSIRVVLAARIAQLSSQAKSLVQVASLGIGALEHNVAMDVLGLDNSELVEAAKEAVSKGILISSGFKYSPVHGLFREIAQASLIEPERTLWHTRIAKAIESGLRAEDPEPIELAHHWAGADEPERALPSFIQAARTASGQGAFDEAWTHWRAAADVLASLPNHPDLSQLLFEAAEAAHRAEAHDASLDLVEWADQNEQDAERRSTLVFARSRYLAASGQLDAAEAICSTMFDDDETTDQLALETGAQSADLLTRLGRYDAAVRRASDTIERAGSRAPDGTALLLATSALACSKAYLGYPELARQSLSEAVRQANETGHPGLIEAASRHYADLLLGPLNELEEGVLLAQKQAKHLVDQGADERYTTLLLATATTGLFRLGRWADARESATAALESDPTGSGVIELLLGRVRVDLGLGDFEAADHDLQTVSSLLGSDPNPRHELPYWTLRAGLAIWRQDARAARDFIRQAFARVDIEQVDDPWLWAATIWHGLRAESMATTPDIEQAVYLFTAMTKIRDENTVHSYVDSTEQSNHLEGYFLLSAAELDLVLGLSRPAVWRKATEVWDACGHPYPAAYARMHLAKTMFEERTRNRAAENILQSAYQISTGLGAMPLSEGILSLARRARVNLDQKIDLTEAGEPESTATLPPESESKLGDLTAREREIIAEVAEGRTNREIGERLFISGRTVGVHVSNILAKLNVKTRVEATSIYIREVTKSA